MRHVPLFRRRLLVAVLVLAAISLGALPARRAARGLSLVLRAANLQGIVGRLADLDTVPVTERLVQIPLERQSVRGRVYQPPRVPRQVVLLTTGLHPAGIDEPRLVALARELAETNVLVVTPEIPELSRFEITPAITDGIERSAVWLASESGLTAGRRIGLMGISFSGGLSVVAAGRPSLRDRVAFVFSFGGHDDLPRVLRYLSSGVEPALRTGAPPLVKPPHDYGVAVILLAVAERVVPSDQVEALRSAVRRFLWASHLDRVDKEQASREFAALRELAPRLPEPSATLLACINNRDVAHLGPVLLPYLDEYGQAPALSPSRSALPSAPVFLLHGTDDNVIPAVESEYLAARLQGRVKVRLLLSDLITHAEVDHPPRVNDVWKLASFWGDLLAQ